MNMRTYQRVAISTTLVTELAGLIKDWARVMLRRGVNHGHHATPRR